MALRVLALPADPVHPLYPSYAVQIRISGLKNRFSCENGVARVSTPLDRLAVLAITGVNLKLT